eukprot:239865-Amphidinium_carterae.1
MGDVNRPHQILHLPLTLRRRAIRPSHLTTMSLKIPMNLHSGKVLRFITLPHQDRLYQSWQPPKHERT